MHLAAEQLHLFRAFRVKYPTKTSVSRVSLQLSLLFVSLYSFDTQEVYQSSSLSFAQGALGRKHGSTTWRGCGSDPVSLSLIVPAQVCDTNENQLCRCTLLLWPSHGEAAASPLRQRFIRIPVRERSTEKGTFRDCQQCWNSGARCFQWV